MKKKEFKRFESVAFIMLEVLAKAVEMKKLQLEEKKLNIDREMWIEKRSGQKVGSQFPSGGYPSAGCPSPEKEFVMNKNHGKDSLLMALEAGIKNGTIKPVTLEELNLNFDFAKNYCQSPKEIHEEAIKKGFESEKKCCQTAFDLIEKAKPVGEPLKTEKVYLNGCHFRVSPEQALQYFNDSKKELFYFVDREKREISIIKTIEGIRTAIFFSTEIYFRWVQQ